MKRSTYTDIAQDYGFSLEGGKYNNAATRGDWTLDHTGDGRACLYRGHSFVDDWRTAQGLEGGLDAHGLSPER